MLGRTSTESGLKTWQSSWLLLLLPVCVSIRNMLCSSPETLGTCPLPVTFGWPQPFGHSTSLVLTTVPILHRRAEGLIRGYDSLWPHHESATVETTPRRGLAPCHHVTSHFFRLLSTLLFKVSFAGKKRGVPGAQLLDQLLPHPLPPPLLWVPPLGCGLARE